MEGEIAEGVFGNPQGSRISKGSLWDGGTSTGVGAAAVQSGVVVVAVVVVVV